MLALYERHRRHDTIVEQIRTDQGGVNATKQQTAKGHTYFNRL
jgi:hypothetical protein